MKLQISISGYAGNESNLESLKNVVPNGKLSYFDGNDITHSPLARRTNEDGQSKSTIKRRKKKSKKKSKGMVNALAVPAPTEIDDPGESSTEAGKNVLPNGADMYYGLIPLEHNPISHMVLSSANSPIKIKTTKD